MSTWEVYVKNMEDEGCQYSGFFDLEGNKWVESKSACLKIEKSQVDTVVKGIKSDKLNTGQSVTFGDRKFMLVDKTDNTAVMKEMRDDKVSKMMVCVSMFKTGVCVGAASGDNEKKSRSSAEKYATYLKDNNM